MERRRRDRWGQARYALVAIAIGLIGGFVWLGLWQLERAEQKHALLNDYELRSRSNIALEQAMSEPAAVRYRRTSVTGRYDAAHQFLIDNIVVDGRPGYYVLTPLRLQRGKTAVLVNRGWLPAGQSREQLPDVTVNDRLRVVDGLVDALPRPGVRLGPDSEEGWPRVIQFPQSEQLAQPLGYPLADVQLLLLPDAADGFLREWRPRVMRPERHFAYAVQWFALAATVAVVGAILILRRGRDER